jgi:hypothetical protein
LVIKCQRDKHEVVLLALKGVGGAGEQIVAGEEGLCPGVAGDAGQQMVRLTAEGRKDADAVNGASRQGGLGARDRLDHPDDRFGLGWIGPVCAALSSRDAVELQRGTQRRLGGVMPGHETRGVATVWDLR